MSKSITVAAGVALAILVACQRMQPADKLLEEARGFRARGDFRAAVIQLKNAAEQSPENGSVRQLLGEVYVEQGDAVSAEKELKRALDRGRPRAEVIPYLGKALLLQGEYQKLLDELSNDGSSAIVLALRGEAQLGLGKPDLAAPLFRQALQARPDSMDALLGLARLAMARERQDEAMRYIEQAIVAQPREIDALRFKGDLLRAQGRLEAARLAYESVLKLRPNNLQARIDIANLAIQAGQLEQARQQIAAARKSQPNSLLVYYAQAMLDFREGQNKSALTQVQQILRAAPDHAPSLLLAGAIETAMGSFTQARGHLQKFLESSPHHPYATRLLAAAALNARQPEEALHLLLPLVGSDASDADVLALAGEAAMQLRKFEQAATYFERASALAPDSTQLQAAQGLSHLGTGEHKRAIAELEQAARTSGAGSRAGALLVMTHLRARDFDKAMQQVEAMLKQGDNPMVQNLRGGVLLAKGDLHGARAGFEQALKLDAQYMPALQNLTQLDLMEKKPDQARRRLNEALARSRDSLPLMIALSKLAAGQGNQAEAVNWLEKACAAHPNDVATSTILAAAYLRSGAREKGMTLARKLHAANPANAEVLALLASAEADSGEHANALESYSKLAVLQARSAAVQMRIALEQLALKRPHDAMVAVRRALALEPDRDDALALASAMLIDGGALPEAISLAQGVQRRRPNDALGFKLEGDALQAQGNVEQALKRYERGFELMRTGPLLISIHRALRASGKRPAANARMDQWLDKNPADARTRLYYASALVQDRDFHAASTQYERLLEVGPNNALVLNDLAWCYLQLADKRAQGLAERAFKLAPQNPAVADTLAAVLTSQGQATRALPLLRKAVDQAPASADIRFHYAQALAQTGDKRAARIQCEQLLALHDLPQRSEVQALMAKL